MDGDGSTYRRQYLTAAVDARAQVCQPGLVGNLYDDDVRLDSRPLEYGHDVSRRGSARSRQAMFISVLLAGTVYTGKNIHDAHAASRHHGLNERHFDLFLTHFRAALEEVGVKAETAEMIRKRLESHRGTDWVPSPPKLAFEPNQP